MNNQGKKAELTPEQEELLLLRNENRNLKCKVKRMTEKDRIRKAEQKKATKEVKKGIMEDKASFHVIL